MAIKAPSSATTLLVDKETLQKAVTEMNARMGFVRDPSATYELSRRLSEADRRANGDGTTCAEEIIRMREEKLSGDAPE